MKPICLSLQAFGPFAGRVHIDFSRLPAESLFLIHGPTGAGKSTLLDGICYALYGGTSGGEREAKDMRSHHASPDAETLVEFEFALGAKRYRIRRAPEQERPARRGSGTVRVPSEVELHEREGESWRLMATRAGEVAERIRELIGFDADQFRQVIMLPQGKFRRLLSAESRDREQILETLFRTEPYKHLQERLRASAQTLQQQARDIRSTMETLLREAEAQSVEALAQKVEESRAALAALSAEVDQSRKARDAAGEALNEGRDRAAKFREHAEAGVAIGELKKDEGSIAAQRQRLEQASRAEQALPAFSLLEAAQKQHQAQAAAVTRTAGELEQAQRALEAAVEQLKIEEGKSAQREAAKKEAMRLEDLRGAVTRLDRAQARQRHETAALKQARDKMAELEARVRQAVAQRDAIGKEIERLTPLAARQEALALQLRRHQQHMTHLRRLSAAEQDSVQAAKLRETSALRVQDRQEKLEAARAVQQAIEKSWRAGQAAVLARHLADGEACPVCGSHVHPAPAVAGHEIPDDEALEDAVTKVKAAERELQQATDAHREAEQEMTARQSALATLRAMSATAGAAGEPALPATAEACQQAVAHLEDEWAAAEAAAKSLAVQQAALKNLEQAHRQSERELDMARQAVTAATAEAAAAEGAVKTLSESVPEALRSSQALEKAIQVAQASSRELEHAFKRATEAHQQAVTRKAQAETASKSAQEALADAKDRLDEARRAFTKALAQAGFADADSFTAARLAPEERENLGKRIKSHEDKMAAASQRWLSAQAAVQGLQMPDLNAMEAAVKQAQAALEDINRRHAVLQAQIDRAEKTLKTLAGHRAELAAMEKRYGILGDLADAANGKNPANMTFQRYVLAAFLDDVLRQASLRLLAMSRNRYSLQRSREVRDRRSAAGLELEVLDGHTGRPRPANTLSGGEGFMASLSLALGLSDVVQSHAGGIQLDTLFIDEGFGSLDPESLDMALHTLADLQQKGRMVGVISHVEELKRQVPAGIEVCFAPKGSAVKVYGAQAHAVQI